MGCFLHVGDINLFMMNFAMQNLLFTISLDKKSIIVKEFVTQVLIVIFLKIISGLMPFSDFFISHIYNTTHLQLIMIILNLCNLNMECKTNGWLVQVVHA